MDLKPWIPHIWLYSPHFVVHSFDFFFFVFFLLNPIIPTIYTRYKSLRYHIRKTNLHHEVLLGGTGNPGWGCCCRFGSHRHQGTVSIHIQNRGYSVLKLSIGLQVLLFQQQHSIVSPSTADVSWIRWPDNNSFMRGVAYQSRSFMPSIQSHD